MANITKQPLTSAVKGCFVKEALLSSGPGTMEDW